jgi:aspartyl protease family protein
MEPLDSETGRGNAKARRRLDIAQPVRRIDRQAFLGVRLLAYGFWICVLAMLVVSLKDLAIRKPARISQSQAARDSTPSRPIAAAIKPVPEAPPAAPTPDSEEAAPAPPSPAYVIAPAENAPPKPAAQPESEAGGARLNELVLTPSRNGNFYSHGEINGNPAVFVVDTGASMVIVPDRLRRALKLTRGRFLQSVTANGIVSMYETSIAQLKLGHLQLARIPAILNPNAPDDTVLLGMSALKQLTMVQENGQMILQQLRPAEAKSMPVSPPPAPKLKKSVKDCMLQERVIDDRVLKCMQGLDEGTESVQTEQ